METKFQVEALLRPGLRDCIRISVGKPEQNEALLAALRRLASRLGQGIGFAQED